MCDARPRATASPTGVAPRAGPPPPRTHPRTNTTTDRYVPTLLVTRTRAARSAVDERARFLLGFVDDRTPVFELLEATGMPLSDGVEALVALYEAGVVGLAEPSGGEAA